MGELKLPKMLQQELLGINNAGYSNLILSFLIGTELLAMHISTFHSTAHQMNQPQHRGAALLPLLRCPFPLGSHPRTGHSHSHERVKLQA